MSSTEISARQEFFDSAQSPEGAQSPDGAAIQTAAPQTVYYPITTDNDILLTTVMVLAIVVLSLTCLGIAIRVWRR